MAAAWGCPNPECLAHAAPGLCRAPKHNQPCKQVKWPSVLRLHSPRWRSFHLGQGQRAGNMKEEGSEGREHDRGKVRGRGT
eukprot:355093-Chlamydomonas_euryale.AAC.4